MKPTRISACATAALVAMTSTASAGPMFVTPGDVAAPQPPDQAIMVHYRHTRHHYHRYYGHYVWGPGAAAAGAALGLLSLGATAAVGGYCGYYGCYPAWPPHYY